MAAYKCCPWKNGYYKLEGLSSVLFLVEGERMKVEPLSGGIDNEHSSGTWKFGDFEEARKEIKDYTGKTNYNVDMVMKAGMLKTKGVVNDEGTRITIWSFSKRLANFELITNKELLSFKEFGDPASAPTSHYELRPDDKGRLLWLSGAPGLGKSTTGLLLSKTAGYVYYEGDTFCYHLNPYLPPDVEEPSLALATQKPLKGLPTERLDVVDKGMKELIKMVKGDDYDKDNMKEYYKAMCKNIKSEKQRMGGDWVVAFIVPSRSFRDYIKEQLGPDLLFVILNMTKEEQIKRIISRHGHENDEGIESLTKIYDIFEQAHEDEKSAINVTITDDMSPKDVVEKVISTVP